MKIKLIRNAALHIEFGGVRFPIDPARSSLHEGHQPDPPQLKEI